MLGFYFLGFISFNKPENLKLTTYGLKLFSEDFYFVILCHENIHEVQLEFNL